MVIAPVSYRYGHTHGLGRVWVEIFGVGQVRVRVASSATGTGQVAEMVDPHTPKTYHSTTANINITIDMVTPAPFVLVMFACFKFAPLYRIIPTDLGHVTINTIHYYSL